MIRTAICLFVATLASPLAAETRLTPEQFERDSAGKTIYFRDTDRQFSAEQYLPDRRVVLLHLGGTCMHGFWRPEGDQMCFIYDVDPGRWHCWHYIQTPAQERLHRFVDETGPTDFELTIIKEDTKPLDCPAPPLGVSFTPAPRS